MILPSFLENAYIIDGGVCVENSKNSKKIIRKALIASLIGSSIEYYDYLLYGTIAALVVNDLFFPTFDKTTGLLIALASFGIPYFFRPLGGIIFSHIGDKIGRKKSLVLTLGIMGISTALIGLLPTYQSIGIWAPILLIVFRLTQGVAVGGEWGGAVLLAVEYSDKSKRGFSGSIPMMGAAIGMILATLTIAIMRILPDAQFMAWGWRVPFVASLALVLIGLWIRSGLEETPDFKETQKKGEIAKLPIATILKNHWKEVLLTTGAKAVETAPYYIFATFGVSYAINTLGMPEGKVLNAVTIGTLSSLIVIPLMGRISDTIGRKFVFIAGSIGVIIFAIPYFYLLSFKSIALLIIATIIGYSIWSVITSVMGTMFSEIFKPEVRYTGISLGYQLGAALFGGTAPLVATYLINKFNGSWIPTALYIMILACLSIICTILLQKLSKKANISSSDIKTELTDENHTKINI